MVYNTKPLEIMCNNQKAIIELSEDNIHIKDNDNEKIIKFNEIKYVDYIDIENPQLIIELNNEKLYNITPISIFDKIYLKDIYESITDYMNFNHEENIYTFEGVDIKESDNLLRIFDIYSNDNEYENVILDIYDKGFIIKTNTFNQEINYDYIEFIEKKYGENEMIWDISLTGDNYIFIYFYIDEDNENVIEKAFKYIKSNILENPRSLERDYQEKTRNILEKDNAGFSKIPHNQKSNFICFILNLFFLGAGYAYLDKWGSFILSFFIIWPIVIFLGLFTSFIPTILYWIYVVLKTNNMVEEYNNGELFS